MLEGEGSGRIGVEAGSSEECAFASTGRAKRRRLEESGSSVLEIELEVVEALLSGSWEIIANKSLVPYSGIPQVKIA